MNKNTKNVPSVETLRGNVYDLSSKGKSKIARLVGEQCFVSVSMDGKKYEGDRGIFPTEATASNLRAL